MATETDVASTVGTWIAAFLAIVALISVVGPLLIWRASRTSKNRALAALDAGTAENGGYVSKGLRVWPDVRLFQQVRAPCLTKRPRVARQKLYWDGQSTPPDKASASWVKLGIAFKGFGVEYDTSDCIVVENEKALLPVARVWILVFGLVGRFGFRRDRGKLAKNQAQGLKSIQARPGERLPGPRPGWQTGDTRWAASSSPSPGPRKTALSGVVGIMELMPGRVDPTDDDLRKKDMVKLELHDPGEVGDLSVEALSLDDLFWLAVGCIPLKGDRVFSIEDVQSISPSVGDDVQSDVSDEPVLPISPSPAAHVHFADDYNGDDYSHYSQQPYNFRQTSPHSPHYIVSPSTPAGQRFGSYNYGPRMFRFSPIAERASSLIEVATIVGAERESMTTLTMTEVEVTGQQRILLEQDSGLTYVPACREWVRLGDRRDSPGGYASGAWFLERSSAQMVAQALAQLPLCAHGYLIYKPTRSTCRTMLTSASHTLPRLLVRMSNDIDRLHLGDDAKQSLSKAMLMLWRHTEKFEYSRSFSVHIWALDKLLEANIVADERVKTAVQVLALTSPEFRDIIGQSVRMLSECIDIKVYLDVDNGTLNVPAVFGIIQKFPVDASLLGSKATPHSGFLEIEYSELLLLTLKATVRSSYLETSLDSAPLFERVMSMSEVLYVP